MVTEMLCSNDKYPEYNFSFKLDHELNPELVRDLLDVQKQHGLSCYLGHVVVSGENFWMPIRQYFTKPTKKIVRYPGCVYINLVGASLIFSYGLVTESAKVAKVGEVVEGDLEKVKSLGAAVWKDTVDSMAPKRILMTVTPKA